MALVPDKCGCSFRSPPHPASHSPRSLHASRRRTIPRVWNVFTAGYFETNCLVMLFNVAALLYLGKRIEPVWGARVRPARLALPCFVALPAACALTRCYSRT